MLDRLLSSPEGAPLEKNTPEVFGAWSGLSGLLSEAARRSDRAAVESILRSHKGYGRTISEVLAARGGPVPRSEIRDQLGLSESHLSHVLRDLDEADLIARVREGRDVFLDLGPIGHDVVDRAVLPAWVTFLVELLGDRQRGKTKARGADAVESGLMSRGAPSRLAAHRLAEALGSSPAVVRVPHVAIQRVGRGTSASPTPAAPVTSGRSPEGGGRRLRLRAPRAVGVRARHSLARSRAEALGAWGEQLRMGLEVDYPPLSPRTV